MRYEYVAPVGLRSPNEDLQRRRRKLSEPACGPPSVGAGDVDRVPCLEKRGQVRERRGHHLTACRKRRSHQEKNHRRPQRENGNSVSAERGHRVEPFLLRESASATKHRRVLVLSDRLGLAIDPPSSP